MNIILRYSVITEEGTVIPNMTETFRCIGTDESKQPARDRYMELQATLFVKNLEYKIEDVPMRRVVKARYAPKGTVYTFEVNFPVKRHEGLEVDDLDRPGHHVYVYAVGTDEVVPEANLGFDVNRLRKAYKAV